MVLIVHSEWRGRGCSHSCSVGGSWEMSHTCGPLMEERGASLHRVRRQLSTTLYIQYSQVNVTQAMRGNHHWVRNNTLPPAHSSCPPGWPAAPMRGLLPHFSPKTAPLSLPRSHNQCKGCSRDLRWFLTTSPQKFNREVTSISLPHLASLGPCRPGATLGAATSWSYLLIESGYRCWSSAEEGSS